MPCWVSCNAGLAASLKMTSRVFPETPTPESESAPSVALPSRRNNICYQTIRMHPSSRYLNLI
ncbi:hypothetical protein Plhal703r1_c11g0059301 [Plasmopara halstedii]